MNPPDQAVRTEVEGGVTTLTLADVDNANTLTGPLVRGLLDGLALANADPDVRVVVVTNDGPIFCAGANLKAPSGADRSAGAPTSDAEAGSATGGLETLLVELQRSPTPVVGRIAGHVVGGGMGLAAALDISIAVDDVKFGFTEVRLGVTPAIISVVCLPKMRRGEAMEAFLRGNRFPARQAAEYGLINRAVPADRLDAEVAAVVADLVRGGPQALGIAKQLVNDVSTMTEADALTWTARLSADLFAGDEAAEGISSFLEKRPAAWAPDPD